MGEPTNVMKTKAVLIRDFQNYGVSMSGLKGKRVGDLQDLATLNNVENVNLVQKDIVKG